MDSHALRVLEFDSVRRQLAALCACSLGQERARAMQPSARLAEAKGRLDETTEARRLLDTRGSLPLGGVTDIRPHLRQAGIGSSLEAYGLMDILGVAQASRSVRQFLQKQEDDYPLLAGLAHALGQYPALESEIGSSLGTGGQVLDTASPDLGRIRSQRKIAASRMQERLNALLNSPLRTFLQDPVIVQRGDRYCVPVKAEHRGAFGGIVHDTSASGATLFMEPQAVVDLGNALKELAIKEEQEVARVLARLTASVARVAESLLVTTETLGLLDYIGARAKLAQAHSATEPTLNQAGLTRLRAARHPLLDAALVVPIDIALGIDGAHVLLITGPNTGGKTVSLKTVGLLTLMAQCGLHVPAAHAELNVFAQVWADIGDEQSLQQSLSTFSGHISNIVRILQSLTPNALVLLDEVGAGTDPAEGAALARALLDALRAVSGVRVIATSHYGELKAYALTADGVQNASVEFDEGTLAPTYRLLQGVPGSSNAFAIAGRLGMPAALLDAARRALTGSDETADLLRELEEGRRSALADARDAERARVEAQMLRRRYQEQLDGLDALRREARQKAQEDARVLLRRAQEKMDNTLSELRRAGTEGKRTERARQAIQSIGQELQSSIERDLSPAPTLPIAPDIPDRPLRRGDRVQITSLGMAGELLDDPHGADSPVAVQVGAIRVSVPPSSLRLAGESGSPPSQTRRPLPQAGEGRKEHENGASSLGLAKAAAIAPELLLLGQRADEAVQNVEKYLDNAYAAGLTQARVVHGKGTGALRRAVQDYLKSHPLVESYTMANADEGGAGATVVTLKAT